MGRERLDSSSVHDGSSRRGHKDRFAHLATKSTDPQVIRVVGNLTDVRRGNVTTTYEEIQTPRGRIIVPIATTDNSTSRG